MPTIAGYAADRRDLEPRERLDVGQVAAMAGAPPSSSHRWTSIPPASIGN